MPADGNIYRNTLHPDNRKVFVSNIFEYRSTLMVTSSTQSTGLGRRALVIGVKLWGRVSMDESKMKVWGGAKEVVANENCIIINP